MPSRRSVRPDLAAALVAVVILSPAALAPGCGVSITAGAIAAILLSKGGSNAPHSVPSVTASTPARSTAGTVTTQFTVSDAQSDLVDVTVTYEARSPVSGTLIAQGSATPVGAPPNDVATQPTPLSYPFTWDYQTDLGGSAAARVVLTFVAADATGSSLAADTASFLVGNDEPTVTVTGPPVLCPATVRDQVAIACTLFDSTTDPADLLVEYSLDGAPFATATSAAGGTTGLQTNDGGNPVTHIFVWNSRTDIGSAAGTIDVRVRAKDAFMTGFPTAGAGVGGCVFCINNNRAPLAILTEPAVCPDDTGDVALDVTIFDDDSDPVDLLVEWSRTPDFAAPGVLAVRRVDVYGESEDPLSPVATDQIFAPTLLGRIPPGLSSHPFDGRSIEILQPPGTSTIPVAPALIDPVGVVVEPGGATALVADRAAGVVRVDLATGSATLLAAYVSAEYLALEPGGASVLVTSATELARVDRTSGLLTILASGLNAPHGVAALSADEAVVVEGGFGGRLTRVDLGTSATTVLASPFATPRGLAADPVHRVVYVAERGADRITQFVLETRVRSTLIGGLPSPTGLAVIADGGTLLVTTDEAGADRLFFVNRANPVGGGAVRLTGLDTPLGVAAAPGDGSLLVIENGAADRLTRLDLGGRVVETGTVASVSGTTIQASAPFAQSITTGTPFRIVGGASEEMTGLASSPLGVTHRIVVDIADRLGTPEPAIYFRVTPSDPVAGAGTSEISIVQKTFAWGVYAEPTYLVDALLILPQAIAAADLNGDGDLDLVSANGSRLMAFFQLSPGTFGMATAIEDAGPPHNSVAVAVGDVDGDGDQDVVSANDNPVTDDVTVYYQTAPGTFTSSPTVVSDAGLADGMADLSLADLDGDADLDIVTANSLTDNLTVWFQSGGAFGAAVVLADGLNTQGSRGVTTGDLDGDGDLDIISANYTGPTGLGSVTIFYQTTPGAFATPPPVLLSSLLEKSDDVAIGDLDGDGDPDIAVATSGWVAVYFQTAPGVFSVFPTLLPVATGGSNPLILGLALADSEGDGDLDIFLPCFLSNDVRLLLQESPGVFSNPPIHVGTVSGTDGPEGLAVADLDGNGHLDIAVANGASNSVSCFFQRSPRTFAPPTVLSDGVSTVGAPIDRSGVTTADLDGDGDQDIAAANQVEHHLEVYFQTAPGVFSFPPLILRSGGGSHTLNACSIAAVDLDGDRDLDLVTTAEAMDFLTVFFQTSPGTFGMPAGYVVSTLDRPVDVAVGDVEGDGDLDIVLCTQGSDGVVTADDAVSIYLQTPPGIFPAAASTTLADPLLIDPSGVALTDLDGDGRMDLIVACDEAVGGGVAIFYQSATPGTFQVPPAFLPAPRARDVAVGDLDGDGDQDIVSANWTGDLWVRFQMAPRSFSPQLQLLTAPSLPYAVALGDLDGDGDRDIVATASAGGNSAVCFLQTAPGVFGAAPLFLQGSTGLGTSQAFGLAVGDLDGDGTPDVATILVSPDRVEVFFRR